MKTTEQQIKDKSKKVQIRLASMIKEAEHLAIMLDKAKLTSRNRKQMNTRFKVLMRKIDREKSSLQKLAEQQKELRSGAENVD